MNTRLLPVLFVSTLLFSACAADPEQAALEQYLEDADTLADQMVEMGTKFETLMNLQDDMLSWSAAGKQELAAVRDSLVQMQEQAAAMTPPAILETVHPTLVEAIQEMRLSVNGVMEIAENPSAASEQLATDIEAHAIKGDELSTQYLEEMEAAIDEEYPEMMEE